MNVIQNLISLAIFVVVLISLWKVFDKSGQPGWTGIL